MKKHLFRSLLIWGAIIVSLLVIYPTVGWMVLSKTSPEVLEARMAKWEAEDKAWAAESHGYFSELAFSLKRWSQCDRDQVINLGLDLQGGIQMVVSFDWHDLDEERIAALHEEDGLSDTEIAQLVQDTLYDQLVNRISEFEAKEPVIQKLGTDQIQAQLPGAQNTDRARDLMTKTALLNFHIVSGQDETVAAFRSIKEHFPNDFSSYLEAPGFDGMVWVKPENYLAAKEMVAKLEAIPGAIPEGKMLAFGRAPRLDQEQRYDLYVLDKKPIATGEGLTSASAIPDPQNPASWAILFNFDAEGGGKFGEATEANINRAMAIVMDGVVMSAPNINSRIDYSGQITGSFSGEEARDLAIVLNSGSMMVDVDVDSVDLVSASLGADSVHSGVTSALWGIFLVGVFVLAYYLVPGGIALIALLLNAILVLAAMAYFDMTLTLPGIAGLILTIGMAVDANVLIFERIREELRVGHSVISSIDSGFSKAAVTILDANVTTLIAAIVLLQFGSGPIEGFAITLSIGVCASVFTSLVVSRALFDFFFERRILKSVKMMSMVPPDTKIRFMSFRKLAGTLSAVAVIGGLVLFGMKLNSGDMLGVDFTQGTNIRMELKGDSEVDIAAVRLALNDAGFDGPTVQKIGTGAEAGNHFMVRVAEIEESDSEGADDAAKTVSQKIQNAMAPLVGGDSANVFFESVKTVGPAVGAQLRADAIWAIIWALLFIVLYIGYRFHLKYAVGAVVALIHDVLITLGIFALFGREINLAVVAAVRTIIGYSLNDTIVVFDRIREDVEQFKGRGKKFTDIINIAINGTLSRTLLTSITTLFVVAVLFIFGGAAIEDFAFALIVGVMVGTYSSIFVASPVVLLFDKFSGSSAAAGDGDKGDEGTRRYKATKKSKKKKEKAAAAAAAGNEGDATA
ncbi:MAG: protein translocase subunit SecD [Candidatus Hydrogenedentes bacterium]|nr:protein translocase subunit SecD [Candidatus Hydrogenedentota bacterium]